MAEALFNMIARAGWRAGSAGTEPSTQVRLEAVTAMREIGIDLSGRQPKHLRDVLGPDVELVVGLCQEEACPVVPGVRSEHWPLPDPSGKDLAFFRDLREDLRRRVAELAARLPQA